MRDENIIVGIDEANYSPSLAGDCVVVALTPITKVEGVGDSKKISKQRQLELFDPLVKQSKFSVALATVGMIDQIGIYDARNIAIENALIALRRQMNGDWPYVGRVIIDGKWPYHLLRDFAKTSGDLPVEGIVKADETIYECGAASIIARVYADALFGGWDQFYPGYSLGQSHGSPSQVMYRQLYEKGPTPIFRTINYAADWWKRILKDRFSQFMETK